MSFVEGIAWPQASQMCCDNDRSFFDLKVTICDLREQIALPEADQHAVLMLRQLLSKLTTRDVVYMDNITSTNFLYKVLDSERSRSGPDMQKKYHKLLGLCHPDSHLSVHHHIFHQLVAIHNIFTDSATRKVNNCCDVRAITRKESSNFCRLSNPHPYHESLDDLWNWKFFLFSLISNDCADAFSWDECTVIKKHFDLINDSVYSISSTKYFKLTNVTLIFLGHLYYFFSERTFQFPGCSIYLV